MTLKSLRENPLFFRSPDDVVAAVDPAVVALATPPAKADDAKEPPAWAVRRFGELTAEKTAERSRAEKAERELADAQATVAALRAGNNAPPPKPTVVVDEAEVDRRASAKAATMAFNAQCNAVYDKGAETHPTDFVARMDKLKQLGGVSPELASAAIEVGDAHELLYHLGGDLDAASRIMALPPIKQAVELAKIHASLDPKAKAAAPAAKPLSNAPAPPEPIAGRSSGDPDALSDDLPIDKWMARRDKQVRA